MTNLELAKNIIIAYLEKNAELEGILEAFRIKESKAVLKEHIMIITEIFKEALKELEESEKDE